MKNILKPQIALHWTQASPTMARRASFGYHNENKEPAMALFIYKEKKLDAPNIVAE